MQRDNGTQRSGHALFQQSRGRGHALSVVGVPKTIDNDAAFVARTFGYLTAVEEAVKVLDCAHTEARSVHNGVALVKLMDRHAGFIAAKTRYDFFDLVRKRWPFPPEDDPWEKHVAGQMTHFQALAAIFARIRTTEADLLRLAESMELDADFAKSARACHLWGSVPAWGGDFHDLRVAESTVNQVVSKRMVKKPQVRWSEAGTHDLLQVRTKALNDELRETFARWYPGMRVDQETNLAKKTA